MKLNIDQHTNAARRLSHYEAGYIKLRRGIATLAGTFPFIFLASSWILRRTEMQDSISAYYFTEAMERNLFVGILIAIAVFLVLYEGYSKLEDRVLSVAGFCAAGVALVPMGTTKWLILSKEVSLHGIFAVAFYASIFFVCVFLSETTLSDLPADKQRFFRRRYQLFSGAMITSVIVAVFAKILPEQTLYDLFGGKIIFWVEATGVWSFALFWYYKTREINPQMPWRPFARKRES